jgi:hypothetical protein
MNNVAGVSSDLSVNNLTGSYVTVEQVVLDVPDEWQFADLFVHAMVDVESLGGASRVDARIASASQIGDTHIIQGREEFSEHFGIANVANTVTVQLQLRSPGGAAEINRVLLFAEAILA